MFFKKEHGTNFKISPLVIINLLLFLLFFYYSYTYKVVYDDMSMICNSSIDVIIARMKSLYFSVGRPLSPIFYFSFWSPFLYAIISSISILILYGIAPYLIIKYTVPDSNKNYTIYIFCFAITTLIALLFPFQSVIFHDFFIRIMFVLYTMPTAIIVCFTMILWRDIFLDNNKIYNIWYYILLSLLGIMVTVSDIHAIYILAIFCGIIVLKTLRYRQLPKKLPISSLIIGGSVLVGLLFSLTSPGAIKVLTGGSDMYTQNSRSIILLIKDTFRISFFLFCLISVSSGVLLIRDKKKVFHSEYIWTVVFLVCIYFGLIAIFAVAKPPYYRIPYIALLNYPLIYTLIILLYAILSPYIKLFKYTTILSAFVIIYGLFVNDYNIELKNNTLYDIEQIFENSPDNADKIYIPNYQAYYIHNNSIDILQANFSDYLHLFPGERSEYAELGGKYFIQIVRPDTWAFQHLHTILYKTLYPKISNTTIELSTNVVPITTKYDRFLGKLTKYK